jgi:hypothetical protein
MRFSFTLSLFLLFACGTEDNTYLHLVLIQDLTCGACASPSDIEQRLPKYVDITNDGMRLDVMRISSRELGKTWRDSLLPAPGFLDLNLKIREAEAKAFSPARRAQLIKAACAPPFDTTASLVYARIRQGAIELANSSGTRKVLIYVGDALEHSDSLSIYTRDQPKNLLQNKPHASSWLANLRNLYGGLPDMTGIEVIHIHLPTARD